MGEKKGKVGEGDAVAIGEGGTMAIGEGCQSEG